MKFLYDVTGVVEVTATEVETIAALSSCHYDNTCRRACRVGEFIYGWYNSIRFNAPSVNVSAREADLVCKILEGSGESTLINKWHDILLELNAEFVRINHA